MYIPEHELKKVEICVRDLASQQRPYNGGRLPLTLTLLLGDDGMGDKEQSLEFLLMKGEDGMLCYESLGTMEIEGIPGQVLRVPAPA